MLEKEANEYGYEELNSDRAALKKRAEQDNARIVVLEEALNSIRIEVDDAGYYFDGARQAIDRIEFIVKQALSGKESGNE